MRKRVIATLLSFVVALSLMPLSAYAATSSQTDASAYVDESATESATKSTHDERTSSDTGNNFSAEKSALSPKETPDNPTSSQKDAEQTPSEKTADTTDTSSLDAAAKGSMTSNNTATIQVTIKIVGQNKEGTTQYWASDESLEIQKGTSVAEVTERYLKSHNLTYTMTDGKLVSVTSPFENLTLSAQEDATTQTTIEWRLFVNGREVSQKTVDKTSLDANATLEWRYGIAGAAVPTEEQELILKPQASHPEVKPDWGGYPNGKNSAAVDALTPTGAVDVRWTIAPQMNGEMPFAVSDQVIVGNALYFARGNMLYKVDATTGDILKKVVLGGSISRTSRPIVAQGMMIVPTEDGRLSAFTLTELDCVWRSQMLLEYVATYQTLSSLTVSSDSSSVIAGFTKMLSESTSGILVCVSLTDGGISWLVRKAYGPHQPTGYYWSGAVAAGNRLMVGDESGNVTLFDSATGLVKAELALGAPVRTGIIPLPHTVDASIGDGTYVAVTKDGVLHVFSKCGDVLNKTGEVSFAQESFSTPTISGNRVFVGGTDTSSGEARACLSVINLETLTVEHTVYAGEGRVQSAPLVSKQDSGTYVYFTSTDGTGGVWRYKLGDSAGAVQIYTPEKQYQKGSSSSVICDAAGNLYYTNDSGVLFALVARKGTSDDTNKPDPADPPKPSDRKDVPDAVDEHQTEKRVNARQSDSTIGIQTQSTVKTTIDALSKQTEKSQKSTVEAPQKAASSSETSANADTQTSSLPMRTILGLTTISALAAIFSYLYIADKKDALNL